MKNLHTVAPLSTQLYVAIMIASGIFAMGCSTNQAVLNSGGTVARSRPALQQAVTAQSSSYTFQVGDQLRVAIRNYSELDTTVMIGESGKITLKLIGEIQAAGVTRSQLVEDITTMLGKYVKIEVHPTINVLNVSTQKVIVLGAVLRQDNYITTEDLTIFQILAMAGGAIPEADLQHTKIYRNGEPQNVQEVDVIKYMAKGNIKDMPMVNPGDMVYVPQGENILRQLTDFFRDSFFLFTLFTIVK